MNYYLLLNGEVKGPFPLAMVREMLQAGAIQDTTLIAVEGGNAWKPVGTFLDEHPNDSGINGRAAMSGNTHAPTAEPKWYASRNARIAAVLILGLGIWASQGDDGESKKEPTVANDEPTVAPRTHRDGEYRSSTHGSQSSMRSQVRQILAQRYSGNSGLRNEIESGVMKLYDTYPELSASQLIAKFEGLAHGY